MPVSTTELLENIIIHHLETPPWDAYTRYQNARRLVRGEKGSTKEEETRVEKLERLHKELTGKYGGIPLYQLQLVAYYTPDLSAYFYLPNGEETTIADLRADLSKFVAEMDDVVWDAMPRLG